MPGTVALVSGGLDSCVLLAHLLAGEDRHPEWFPIHVLSFKYGSVHQDAETESAKAVANHYLREVGHRGLSSHTIFEIPTQFFAGSALTDKPGDMPSGRALEEMVKGVAPTYVPARNTVFLALAAGRADVWGCSHVAYAAHWEDAPGYPDCRPEYFEAMDHAIRLGTTNEVRVLAPFIRWSKSDIIERGLLLEAPLRLTHSCYRGKKPACGVCDTCILRIESFKRLGMKDPIPYEIEVDWNV